MGRCSADADWACFAVLLLMLRGPGMAVPQAVGMRVVPSHGSLILLLGHHSSHGNGRPESEQVETMEDSKVLTEKLNTSMHMPSAKTSSRANLESRDGEVHSSTLPNWRPCKRKDAERGLELGLMS